MESRLIFIAFLVLGLSSCSNSDDCTDSSVNNFNLEDFYGCTNTKYQMNVDLSEDYMVIRNQSDFDAFVSGTCQPAIDFSIFDLIIGKKGLTSGNESITYDYIKNCKTNNLTLVVTFTQNATAVAPNLTYHALIPKLQPNQEVNVEFIIN